MTKRFLTFWTVLSLTSACNNSNLPEANTEALVNRPTFTRAMDTLRNSVLIQEAIPWDFIDDGCFARALLVGAKLAVEGLAASSVYVVSGPTSYEVFEIPLPQYDDDILGMREPYWRYHVAPLFVVRDPSSDSQQVSVVDLAFSGQRTPVSFSADEWIEKFSHSETRVCKTLITPASKYLSQQNVSLKSCSAQKSDAAADICENWSGFAGQRIDPRLPWNDQCNMISSADEYKEKQFLVADVADACQKLHSFVNEMTRSEGEKEEIQRKLIAETQTLMKSLAEQGMLRNSVPPKMQNSARWRGMGDMPDWRYEPLFTFSEDFARVKSARCGGKTIFSDKQSNARQSF